MARTAAESICLTGADRPAENEAEALIFPSYGGRSDENFALVLIAVLGIAYIIDPYPGMGGCCRTAADNGAASRGQRTGQFWSCNRYCRRKREPAEFRIILAVKLRHRRRRRVRGDGQYYGKRLGHRGLHQRLQPGHCGRPRWRAEGWRNRPDQNHTLARSAELRRLQPPWSLQPRLRPVVSELLD